MKIEVEQKFAIDNVSTLRQQLIDLDAQFEPPQAQSDTYLAHPARDFAVTDEALRIRVTSDGAAITYKGPRLDATTKTRRELELPLSGGQTAVGDWEELLKALGFTVVACVRKQRVAATVPWQGTSVEAALDEVEGVGSFIELERVVEQDGLEEAQRLVESLATHLGLTRAERRSYLELLLERSAAG